MLTFSMDALFIRGMRKHRHLGTLRCRQEGASTPSISWTGFDVNQTLPIGTMDVAIGRVPTLPLRRLNGRNPARSGPKPNAPAEHLASNMSLTARFRAQ